MSDQRTIKQEVYDLNSVDDGELGRWIRIHVYKVSKEMPVELVTTRRRRHIAPRAVEVNKQAAQELIEILQEGLDRNLPGTISFVLYGREEL